MWKELKPRLSTLSEEVLRDPPEAPFDDFPFYKLTPKRREKILRILRDEDIEGDELELQESMSEILDKILGLEPSKIPYSEKIELPPIYGALVVDPKVWVHYSQTELSGKISRYTIEREIALIESGLSQVQEKEPDPVASDSESYYMDSAVVGSKMWDPFLYSMTVRRLYTMDGWYFPRNRSWFFMTKEQILAMMFAVFQPRLSVWGALKWADIVPSDIVPVGDGLNDGVCNATREATVRIVHTYLEDFLGLPTALLDVEDWERTLSPQRRLYHAAVTTKLMYVCSGRTNVSARKAESLPLSFPRVHHKTNFRVDTLLSRVMTRMEFVQKFPRRDLETWGFISENIEHHRTGQDAYRREKNEIYKIMSSVLGEDVAKRIYVAYLLVNDVQGNYVDCPGVVIKSKKIQTPKVQQKRDTWSSLMTSEFVWLDAKCRTFGEAVVILQDFEDGMANMRDGVIVGKNIFLVVQYKVAVARVTDAIPALYEEAYAKAEYVKIRFLSNEDATVPHRFRPYAVEGKTVIKIDPTLLPGLHWICLVGFAGETSVRPFHVSPSSRKRKREPVGIDFRRGKSFLKDDSLVSTDIARVVSGEELEIFGRRWNPLIDSWLFSKFMW
jgi:hypothetical protein